MKYFFIIFLFTSNISANCQIAPISNLSIQGIFKSPNLVFGSMSDIDGNTYKTIRIGNQVWMAENLKTTKYNDGTSIRYETDDNVWTSLTEGAYCYYDNNITYKNKLGILYNWMAVNTNKLAPQGWHVPSAAEWLELENYLKNNGYNNDNSSIGNKIAKAIATKYDWGENWNSFDVGQISHKGYQNNSVGFNGIPAGRREAYTGTPSYYTERGVGAYWWTSDFVNYASGGAKFKWIRSNNKMLFTDYYLIQWGYSVRCVKD